MLCVCESVLWLVWRAPCARGRGRLRSRQHAMLFTLSINFAVLYVFRMRTLKPRSAPATKRVSRTHKRTHKAETPSPRLLTRHPPADVRLSCMHNSAGPASLCALDLSPFCVLAPREPACYTARKPPRASSALSLSPWHHITGHTTRRRRRPTPCSACSSSSLLCPVCFS